MAKKAKKRNGKMTGKFPSVKGFMTRCERIVRRAGTTINCTKLYSAAKKKHKGGNVKIRRKKSG